MPKMIQFASQLIILRVQGENSTAVPMSRLKDF